MAYKGSQVKNAEICRKGIHGFPRVSRRGHRGDQAENGEKWQEMDFRAFFVNPLLL